MKNIVFILFSFALAAEMEVDGNLKVTGTVDANGNPITNVGAPLLSTDAASAGYVLNATAGKGRIITVKCPWIDNDPNNHNYDWNSCEPPVCPNGWDELVVFNEVVAMTYRTEGYWDFAGNSIRYCMEQETGE